MQSPSSRGDVVCPHGIQGIHLEAFNWIAKSREIYTVSQVLTVILTEIIH